MGNPITGWYPNYHILPKPSHSKSSSLGQFVSLCDGLIPLPIQSTNMLKGVDLNARCCLVLHDHAHARGLVAFDDFYSSDELRMYAYKIKRCPRMHSHDWTECPYVHQGEKARHRDPCRYDYWLHPARYRMRACNAGRFCQLKVFFFTHSAEELRTKTKYKSNCVYKARAPRDDVPVSMFETTRSEESRDAVSEFLRRLSIGEKEGAGGGLDLGKREEWRGICRNLNGFTDLVD